jgi:hypothetical protein
MKGIPLMPFKRAEAENALGLIESGNLLALARYLRTFSRGPITLTTGASLNNRDYLNRTIVHNAAGGGTFTLPPATGGGDKVRIVVKTTVTSSLIVAVANSSDTMQGTAVISQDAADTAVMFEAGATADTITLNGTTTGGLFGAEIECEDIATNLWHVRVLSAATGVEATPFSAAV